MKAKDMTENVAAKPQTTTFKLIGEALQPVHDPEIHISIVDLGLVYGAELGESAKGRSVKVRMSLTSPACPYGPMLLASVHTALTKLPGIKDVDLPPGTEARHVRLRILSGHNPEFDRVQLGEFRLFNTDGVNVVAVIQRSGVTGRARDGSRARARPLHPQAAAERSGATAASR